MERPLLSPTVYRLLTNRCVKTFNTLVKSFLPIIFVLTLGAQAASAQTLYPTGFSQVLVANGILKPTVMAFAPDGRIFVAQQGGRLRVIKNGVLLPTPFIILNVDSAGERGLLGIAFDPAFANNQFIYLYYTLGTSTNNRISRFTANGDVVVPNSEVPVLNLNPLSSATNHNGGTMQFGPDGKLYVGVGENANGANAQNLGNYLGKVLRINSDGSIPTGNPFSGSASAARIWHKGLRNPYTITFQPGTGRLFINDVGQNTWEEIDDGTIGGKNFGWPIREGFSNDTFANPVYAYMHGSGSGVGCAITGGTFFNPSSTNYPSTHIGKYFFIDYCSNWIDMLTLNGNTGTRTPFASNIAGSPVSIITGPDGNLYFLSRATSAVYKITYTPTQSTVVNPVADAHVRGGTYGNTNYGGVTLLTTKNATNTTNNIFQTYLRFNISSFPTNSSSVKLRLYGYLYYATDPNVSVQVFNVPSLTWGETTITYFHRPAAQTTVLASANVSGTSPRYYEWDITAHINALRASGATFVSLEVRNLTVTNYNQVNFNSREMATNKPQLLSSGGTAQPLSLTTEIAEPQSVDVYPNPAKGSFTVRYPSSVSDGTMRVIDLQGRVIMKEKITQKNERTVNTNSLKPGSYILIIEKGDQKYSKQIAIKK
jgi:glucose/arabinose dehydrogenase